MSTEAYKISQTATNKVHRRTLMREIRDAVGSAEIKGVQESRDPPPDDNLTLEFDQPVSAPDKILLDGVVGVHQGIPTTSEFTSYESNPAQTNATTNFATAITRTTPALREGSYIFSWECQMEVIQLGPGIDSRGIVQFQVDGVSKNTSSWNQDAPHNLSGSSRVIVEEGDTPTILLRFKRDNALGGDDTIQVSKLLMSYELKG